MRGGGGHTRLQCRWCITLAFILPEYNLQQSRRCAFARKVWAELRPAGLSERDQQLASGSSLQSQCLCLASLPPGTHQRSPLSRVFSPRGPPPSRRPRAQRTGPRSQLRHGGRLRSRQAAGQDPALAGRRQSRLLGGQPRHGGRRRPGSSADATAAAGVPAAAAPAACTMRGHLRRGSPLRRPECCTGGCCTALPAQPPKPACLAGQ